MNIVFVLGAGASVDYGAPLMLNFFDKAEDIVRDRCYGYDLSAFEDELDPLLRDLRHLHAVASLDTQNIESVMGILETARLVGYFDRWKPEKIERANEVIRTVYYQTIEGSMRFKRDGLQDTGLQHLAALCKEVGLNVKIVTFNCDLALEYELHRLGIPFFYDERRRPSGSTTVQIFKLHGSLNWWMRAGGGGIHEVSYDQIEDHWNHPERWQDGMKQDPDVATAKGEPMQVSHFCRELNREYKQPLIVPPTWHKFEHYNKLQKVWRDAAIELSLAERIYFVGYSLPTTDTLFWQYLALTLSGRTRLRRLGVIDYAADEDAEVFQRYRKFLGGELKGRFKPFHRGFRTEIDALMLDLGL